MPRKLSRYLRGLTTEVGIRTSRNFVIAQEEKIADTDSIALQVDSGGVFTGSVGVGTTIPGQELEVFSDNNFAGIRVKSTRTDLTDQIGGVGFSTSSDQVASINALVDGSLLIKNTTSDTERFRITSDGKIGIETGAPVSKFEIWSGISTTSSSLTPPSSSNLRIVDSGENDAVTQDMGGVVLFTYRYDNDGNNDFLQGSPYIKAVKKNDTLNDYGGGLAFGVRESGSAGQTESLRITSSSDVGISSSNPQEKLDVVGNVKLSGNLQIGAGATLTAPTNDSLEVKVGVGTTALNISPGGVVFNTAGRSWWSDIQATGAPGTTGFTAYTDPDLQTTQLDQQYSYLFRLVTTGTGTNTGAVYLVWYSNDTTSWRSHLSSAQGTTSNHPLLRINGSTVEIYTEHASSYNILYNAERYFVDETDSTAHIFGSDYTWTRISSNVGFNTTSPEKNFTVTATDNDEGIRINAHDKTSRINFYPHDNSYDPDYPRLAYYDNDWNPSGSSDVATWHIDGHGRTWQKDNLYIGRTRTYAAAPVNYYPYYGDSGPGIFIYNGESDSNTTVSAQLNIRCYQTDTDDRNVIYWAYTGTANTLDYDQHQYFGVKANGKVQGKNAFFSGRVESDEETPNSVYLSGRGGFYGYDTNSTAISYLLAEAGASTTTYFTYNRTGDNDVQWTHRTSDGRMYVDASATTFNGADYAEYFEWDDANANNEDRAGYTVVLKNGNKIGIATAGDSPSSIIGVISGAPAIVGDGQDLSWQGKWLKDEFGREVTTDVEYLVWNSGYEDDENGNRVPVTQPNPNDQMSMQGSDKQVEVGPKLDAAIAEGTVPQFAIDNNIRMTGQRRVKNPEYNPDAIYVPREFRPEWSPVGLVGKLIVRKGQVMGDRWIKMKDVNEQLEQWLVR